MNKQKILNKIKEEIWVRKKNSSYSYDTGTTWRIEKAIESALDKLENE